MSEEIARAEADVIKAAVAFVELQIQYASALKVLKTSVKSMQDARVAAGRLPVKAGSR